MLECGVGTEDPGNESQGRCLSRSMAPRRRRQHIPGWWKEDW